MPFTVLALLSLTLAGAALAADGVGGAPGATAREANGPRAEVGAGLRAKADTKTEAKADTKPDAKADTKADTKADGKPGAKDRAKGNRKSGGAVACKRDADCVLVSADCCPCSAGGKQRALPAKEKAAYERSRQDRCSETMCTAMMSTDPSCAATTAVCKSGRCELGGPPTPAAGGG